jgi:hypothetical protein
MSFSYLLSEFLSERGESYINGKRKKGERECTILEVHKCGIDRTMNEKPQNGS